MSLFTKEVPQLMTTNILNGKFDEKMDAINEDE